MAKIQEIVGNIDFHYCFNPDIHPTSESGDIEHYDALRCSDRVTSNDLELAKSNSSQSPNWSAVIGSLLQLQCSRKIINIVMLFFCLPVQRSRNP